MINHAVRLYIYIICCLFLMVSLNVYPGDMIYVNLLI